MKHFNRQGAFLALGAAVVLAATLSVYAASIGTDSSSAGQGANVVAGYSAGEFRYTTVADESTDDDSGLVTQVEFWLKKTQDGEGPSTVTDAGTDVFVQLMGRPDEGNADWAGCTVGLNPETQAPGWVTCDISGDSQKALDDVDALNIVAYDSNE